MGYLARITIDPGERGQGLAAALTSAMTRTLRDEFSSVALGVTVDNHAALQLYQRLGYRITTGISTYELLG